MPTTQKTLATVKQIANRIATSEHPSNALEYTQNALATVQQRSDNHWEHIGNRIVMSLFQKHLSSSIATT